MATPEITDTPELEPATDNKLTKSINEMVAETFPDFVKKATDTAKDARTTADAVVKKAPKSENDKSRGAGRPKEISDVPNVDEDGARGKDYDSSITEREGKEEENKEAKKQAPSIDQTSDKGHTEKKPKAPKMPPFKKGEDMDVEDEHFQKSYAKYLEFETIKKADAEPKAKAPQVEVETVTIPKSEFDRLSKGTEIKAEPNESLIKSENLIKSEVAKMAENLQKSISDLTTANQEQAALLKSIGARPVAAKAVTSVDALEKSVTPAQEAGIGVFSKSQKADAAFQLAKAGKLPVDAAVEVETSGTLANPEHRALVEAVLLGGAV